MYLRFQLFAGKIARSILQPVLPLASGMDAVTAAADFGRPFSGKPARIDDAPVAVFLKMQRIAAQWIGIAPNVFRRGTVTRFARDAQFCHAGIEGNRIVFFAEVAPRSSDSQRNRHSRFGSRTIFLDLSERHWVEEPIVPVQTSRQRESRIADFRAGCPPNRPAYGASPSSWKFGAIRAEDCSRWAKTRHCPISFWFPVPTSNQDQPFQPKIRRPGVPIDKPRRLIQAEKPQNCRAPLRGKQAVSSCDERSDATMCIAPDGKPGMKLSWHIPSGVPRAAPSIALANPVFPPNAFATAKLPAS